MALVPATSGQTSGTPTGAASGALAGNYPAPTLVQPIPASDLSAIDTVIFGPGGLAGFTGWVSEYTNPPSGATSTLLVGVYNDANGGNTENTIEVTSPSQNHAIYTEYTNAQPPANPEILYWHVATDEHTQPGGGGIIAARNEAGVTKLGFFMRAGTGNPIAQPAAIAAPAGGATVDAQARTAITAIINLLSAAAGGYGLTA